MKEYTNIKADDFCCIGTVDDGVSEDTWFVVFDCFSLFQTKNKPVRGFCFPADNLPCYKYSQSLNPFELTEIRSEKKVLRQTPVSWHPWHDFRS